MGSLSGEERAALRDSVHRLLADRSSEADVRRTMETETGYDAALDRFQHPIPEYRPGDHHLLGQQPKAAPRRG